MYMHCMYVFVCIQKPRDDNIKCTASNRKFMFLFLFSQLRSNYTHPMTVKAIVHSTSQEEIRSAEKKNLLAIARR